MNVNTWVLEAEYDTGLEHALQNKPMHYKYVCKQQKKHATAYNRAYIYGYETGQRHLLTQLILKDPK